MNFKSIILAAGKGTRMKTDLPKVVHKVNGVSMINKVISVLEKAGSSENILILGHKRSCFRRCWKCFLCCSRRTIRNWTRCATS